MNVKVESCWAGNNKYYFRLDFMQAGRLLRLRVNGHEWTRSVASEALNILEVETGLRRKSFRFVHK